MKSVNQYKGDELDHLREAVNDLLDTLMDFKKRSVSCLKYAGSLKFGGIMSFFNRIFVGKVIKGFGTLEEKSFIIGKVKKSLLLTEGRGELKIAFKWSGYAMFSFSIQYFDLSAESLPKLCQFMDEMQEIVNQRANSLSEESLK